MKDGDEMKYRASVVAYESYGEIELGNFDVDADNEYEADLKAKRAAKRLHPSLEDLDVMELEEVNW